MAKSLEEQINSIRDRMFEAIMELENFREESGVHSPRLKHAAVILEFLAVDFERFVNALPAEARS